MIFPLLFTSGMCLVDATDGIVMLGAYGWAFIKPVRKLFYNMTITMVSFVIAFLIGGLEVLSVIAEKFHLESGIWAVVKTLSDNSTATGFAIIGLMLGMLAGFAGRLSPCGPRPAGRAGRPGLPVRSTQEGRHSCLPVNDVDLPALMSTRRARSSVPCRSPRCRRRIRPR